MDTQLTWNALVLEAFSFKLENDSIYSPAWYGSFLANLLAQRPISLKFQKRKAPWQCIEAPEGMSWGVLISLITLYEYAKLIASLLSFLLSVRVSWTYFAIRPVPCVVCRSIDDKLAPKRCKRVTRELHNFCRVEWFKTARNFAYRPDDTFSCCN